MENRAAQFIFASFLCSYPPKDFRESLGEFLRMPDLGVFAKLSGFFAMLCKDEVAVDELRVRYIDLFDRGRSENPLYESEYGKGRAFAKGGELVDIAGFYRAFGFAQTTEGSQMDMHDHIAVELEFYGLMLLKESALIVAGNLEGSEIVSDARRKFLEAHLGRFASVLCSRPLVAADPYFGLVFGCTADLVEQECTLLGATPQRPDWYASESEEEQMLCGAPGFSNEESASNLVQIR
jgi:nitrate reductase assembly molybdenum cofactor insertion protein NarJ